MADKMSKRHCLFTAKWDYVQFIKNPDEKIEDLEKGCIILANYQEAND